jgi:hypothetical protein
MVLICGVWLINCKKFDKENFMMHQKTKPSQHAGRHISTPQGREAENIPDHEKGFPKGQPNEKDHSPHAIPSEEKSRRDAVPTSPEESPSAEVPSTEKKWPPKSPPPERRLGAPPSRRHF